MNEGNLLEVEEEEKDEEEEEEDHAGRAAAGSSANYIPIRYRPSTEKTRARRILLGMRQERERLVLYWKQQDEMAKADRAVANADLGAAAAAAFAAYEDALAERRLWPRTLSLMWWGKGGGVLLITAG